MKDFIKLISFICIMFLFALLFTKIEKETKHHKSNTKNKINYYKEELQLEKK